jgi:hypothetical protein
MNMKIAINWNNTVAFWEYFEPKGLKLMCSRTPAWAYECIVAGSEEVLAEVKEYPGVVCL